MKSIYLLVTALGFTLVSFSQASSSENFELTVHFDTDMHVETIIPYYYKTSGQIMDNIYYTVNTAENTLTLKGHNSFIIGVNFPVLAFIETKLEKPKYALKEVQTQSFYYLVSYVLASYTGKQSKKFLFSKRKEQLVINVSQEYYNTTYSHDTLKINTINFYPNDPMCIPITNELVKINKL
jgi:hypothetical protein